MNNLKTFLIENNLRPEFIAYLLQQGIEIERLRCQIEDSKEYENYENTIRILQGERFYSILSVARFA